MNTYTKGGEKHMTIDITIKVDLQKISDVLCSAFEGGSNYWYMLEKKIAPKKWTFGEITESGNHWAWDYALNKGGALIISDEVALDEGEEKREERLDLDSIKNGLLVMARDYPGHFANLMDDYDAETGDVFLQCCLFGDIIYS